MSTLPAPFEQGKDSLVQPDRGLSTRVALAALVLIVIAAFSNSLGGQFVYDDVQQVDTNQLLGHWDSNTVVRIVTHDIKATLRQDLPDGHVYSYYYRPAFMMYLMAGYEVAGHNPLWWHCLAVGLHILASVLAFLVVRKILIQAGVMEARHRSNLAFLAALIFAIHPVQCESVSWISGSVNPLVAVLGLLSIYSYLLYKEWVGPTPVPLSGKTALLLAAAGIFFSLAVFAKESALFIPLLVAGLEIFVFNKAPANGSSAAPLPGCRSLKRRLLSLAPFTLVTIGYLAIRLTVLGLVSGEGARWSSPEGLIKAARGFLTVPTLLVRYQALMVLPWKLSVNYDFDPDRAPTFASFVLPATLLIASGLLLWFFWTKSRAARAGILWLIIPLLPHLNPRFFSAEELIHDRYLYVSMLGAGILVSLSVNLLATLHVRAWRICAAATASCLVILLCILTVSQNGVWRNNLALWSNAARRAPNSRMVHFWLGSLAESRNDLDEAASQYSAAAAADQNCIDCLNNLAFVYAHQSRWDESIQTFERVVALTPGHSIAHFNLSFAYAVVGRYKDAMREQKVAIELDPNGARVEEWRARERQLEALAQSPNA